MNNNNLIIHNHFLWQEDMFLKMLYAVRYANFAAIHQSLCGEREIPKEVIVILDNPGLKEDREGKEFICDMRQTLQQAAALAGFTPVINMSHIF